MATMRANKILDEFRDAAVKQGMYLEDGDSKRANREMDKVIKCYEKIKKINQVDIFVPLLESKNKYVQLRAAVYLLQLEEYRDRVELILKDMVEELENPGQYGFYAISAKYTLKNWKEGKLDCF